MLQVSGTPGRRHEAYFLITQITVQQVVLLTSYEGVSKGFRTGRLERELHMVQLSVTRCSCIAILRVNLVSFTAIRLYSRVFIVVVVVYFVIDSVRKLLDIPSYLCNVN
jgi:hypothetical protein